MNQSSLSLFKSFLYLGAISLSGIGLAHAQTSFTVVALPDTQNYVNDPSDAALFTQQTQWIADEVQGTNSRNIQFVSHLGDVVSDGDDLTQWQRADTSLDVLDGVIEYSVLPGNHDYNSTGNKSTGTVNYLNNFGPSRFAGESWYGGADPSGNNSYQTFTAGGHDFIHLALEWRSNQNVPFRDPSPIAWAQSIIDANPNKPVILSTHEHLDDNPAGRSGSGEAVWDQLIKNNDQIFMVLGGHYHSVGGSNDGEYHQVSTNNAGRPVFEVLQNYQDYPNGGNGWLRLINFDIPNDKIEFETYSPVLDQFQTETVAQVGQFASQFEFNVDFSSRLTPVILPPLPTPDLVFQEGVNGYAGTFDKEIRSAGSDSTNGQAVELTIDGDDGSPGDQPTQGLIRFDNIIGTGSGQIDPSASIDQALLVLEISGSGSGFQVHEMLASWNENSTWLSLGGGVQANGTEAVATPIASFGADNNSSNIGSGTTLEIDVTSTIQDYLDGTLTNHGWALLPFISGTNGIDFFSSEETALDVRPSLEIFLADTSGDFDEDGDVDGQDFLKWQRGELSNPLSASDLAIWQTQYGETPQALLASSTLAVPEPSSVCLVLLAGLIASLVSRQP